MTAKLFFTRLSFPFSLPFIALKDALYRPNKKYKALKNKHEGERCFIVCTGPSLTLEDVNKLKNEYTFSMNNIFKCYDKTDWRPTYYGVSDYRVYNRLKKQINDPNTLKESVFLYSTFEVMYHGRKNPQAVPVYCSNRRNAISLMKDLSYKHVGMSKKLDRYVNNGCTVAFILIQIAIYMGFKEIYMLGADCTYQGKAHSDLAPNSEKQKVGKNDGLKIIDIYSSLIKDIPEDVKIFNATRGGMLELFPRVDLDEILKA